MSKIISSVFLFSCCCSLMGQGSFQYVSYHTGGLFSHVPLRFDLNRDGNDDVEIRYVAVQSVQGTGSQSFEGVLLNGTRLITDAYYFESASILNEGQLVDDVSTPVRLTTERLSNSTHPQNWIGDVGLTGFSLGGAYNGGSGGIFSHAESIVGIQLLEQDGYHNGWIRFEKAITPTSFTIRVADWAYNLNPGEAILAGMLQVPEPRTWTMFLLGFVLLIWRFK